MTGSSFLFIIIIIILETIFYLLKTNRVVSIDGNSLYQFVYFQVCPVVTSNLTEHFKHQDRLFGLQW